MTTSTLITAVAAVLSTAGFASIVSFFAERRKKNADALKTTVEAENIEWIGWRGYAEKLEARMDELEAKYERQLASKDAEIEALQKQVIKLKVQVEDLEKINKTNETAKAHAIEVINHTL